ncbi:ERIC4 protein, partial [Crocuta crocuta]
MELWRQLRQAGLVPPGLGPPPRALRGPPPVRTAGQTLSSSGWHLRQVDVQLLGQLCSLGLEMGALREDLVTFLEEEESLVEEEEEEEEEPQRKQEEGHLGVSCSAPGHQIPDFEMTI